MKLFTGPNNSRPVRKHHIRRGQYLSERGIFIRTHDHFRIRGGDKFCFLLREPSIHLRDSGFECEGVNGNAQNRMPFPLHGRHLNSYCSSALLW